MKVGEGGEGGGIGEEESIMMGRRESGREEHRRKYTIK